MSEQSIAVLVRENSSLALQLDSLKSQLATCTDSLSAAQSDLAKEAKQRSTWQAAWNAERERNTEVNALLLDSQNCHATSEENVVIFHQRSLCNDAISSWNQVWERSLRMVLEVEKRESQDLASKAQSRLNQAEQVASEQQTVMATEISGLKAQISTVEAKSRKELSDAPSASQIRILQQDLDETKQSLKHAQDKRDSVQREKDTALEQIVRLQKKLEKAEAEAKKTPAPPIEQKISKKVSVPRATRAQSSDSEASDTAPPPAKTRKRKPDQSLDNGEDEWRAKSPPQAKVKRLALAEKPRESNQEEMAVQNPNFKLKSNKNEARPKPVAVKPVKDKRQSEGSSNSDEDNHRQGKPQMKHLVQAAKAPPPARRKAVGAAKAPPGLFTFNAVSADNVMGGLGGLPMLLSPIKR